MSTYVYGIIRASHSPLPEDLDGVGDPSQPVRVLREGELAAIVSDAPEELRPKRRDLLAHQHVLDEAGADGVVLPMRFASAAPDDDTVTRVLAERAGQLLERLQALDGMAEYNIKANHNEDAVLRLIMASHDDIRSLAQANREAGGGTQEDRIRLGEMVAAAVQEREAGDAELLHQALAPMVRAVSVGAQSTGWLANLSCLVERRSAERFLTAVDALRQEHPHLELRVNGPLPPYSFAESPSSPQAEGGITEVFGTAATQQDE
ncbi:GvpL/GvpF family gas vesicle protein [Streptomyces sp. Go40/10]|uniref:GvpL/GvpF family gas vesicle protein n=1 Tax=Streptomyces sp. Go40/10 TaxID=2825844 RepID=UPI001E28F4DD|nr:GvpL/GvpF family gas vesicle protein [Streptomyces sp. Go40/10]UFR00868.1 GvpL/GvpF family gas vesicle protein [Streptomyces sp. Go40/10]